MTSRYAFIILFALLILISCGDEDEECMTSTDLISTVWVAQFTVLNGQQVDAPNDVTLTFANEISFGLDLEINSCGGTVDLNGNSVNITEIFCTEACCDSDFSNDLVFFLSTATEIKVDCDGLTFSDGDNLAHFESEM
ncbi:MAG: META domain-containing protein [Bacteroidota bacterium]